MNYIYLPKHFKTCELVSKKVYELLGENALSLLNPGLLKDLDSLRDNLKKKITVNTWFWEDGGFENRGFRAKDSTVGSLGSQHRIGNAIDFDIQDMDAVDVRTYILKNKDQFPAITRMESHVTWIHVDGKPLREDQERVYLFKP